MTAEKIRALIADIDKDIALLEKQMKQNEIANRVGSYIWRDWILELRQRKIKLLKKLEESNDKETEA